MSRRPAVVELVLVVALFCVPLFLGLRGRDLQNDESIYSYAVDRMVETGEWLTPRAIPGDGPFLEKPPLKFWIVAGAIRSGLLPHDERGLRFFDALFGAVAFVYVFLFGRWIGGPGCGFVATLILFTMDSLLFEHGLRSNNMEGALFLTYCGGLYHFARWADGPGPPAAFAADAASAPKTGGPHLNRGPKGHAVAYAAFFVLGFMTKFVAALFLPLIAAAAFLWRPDAWQRLRSGWRDWIVPTALVILAIAPWFLYQTAIGGNAVWRQMFGVHVYDRFSAALDAQHVKPWYFYVYHTWDELAFADSHWVVAAGVVMLAATAWTGRSWATRLVLVWLVVPWALISIPASKVSHYAYPYYPPLALGAGLIAVTVFRGVDRALARAIDLAAPWFRRALTPMLGIRLVDRIDAVTALTQPVRWTHVRQGLLAVALLLLGVAMWTDAIDRVRWQIGGLELRNSSVSRPVFQAAILLALAGIPAIRRVAAMAAVALVLPVWSYPPQAAHVVSVGRPLQAIRSCARAAPASQRDTRAFAPYGQLLNHAFYYYPRQIGRWIESDRVDNDELMRRLYEPGEEMLVIIPRSDYEEFSRKTGRSTPGIGLSDDLILLTPGALAPCAMAALAAGGTKIGGVFDNGKRH